MAPTPGDSSGVTGVPRQGSFAGAAAQVCYQGPGLCLSAPPPQNGCRLISWRFQVQVACQSHLPTSQAGRRREGKRRKGKGKETKGGRKGRNKCFLFRLVEPSQKSHYTFCISLVRTVSHGHIKFPWSLLHTLPRIPLVRTVSHGHHCCRRGFGELVFQLDTLHTLHSQSSFRKEGPGS